MGHPFIPQRPDDDEDEFRIPDDLSGLLLCPTCGRTKLGGMMMLQGSWLHCSECHTVIPDTEKIRRALHGLAPWAPREKSE